MLLNQHKNYIQIALTVAAVVVIVVMMIVTSTIELFGGGRITPNQFSSYGMVNAQTVASSASDGVKAETIKFEFEDSMTSLDANALSSLGNSLRKTIEEEPAIFNVHGVGEGDRDIEFLFESISPTDYESSAFRQAASPFTRLLNSPGIDGVKFFSTVDESGARHVTIESKSNDDSITGKEAAGLWRTMLIVLSPLSENTSYSLSLETGSGIRVHGMLSSEAEQTVMTESIDSNNWDEVFALAGYGGVQQIDFYVQGGNSRDNTVALTVTPPASLPDYVKNMNGYVANEANTFPRNFTTTVTVEGESTPAHTIYPKQ